MTKTNAFKARMVLCGYTIKSLAKEIDSCEQNLALKINGKRQFRQVEMFRISRVLKLKPSEFFYLFGEVEQDDRQGVC